ncbi:unnamed protein product, partial [Pleuronectes platessa]
RQQGVGWRARGGREISGRGGLRGDTSWSVFGPGDRSRPSAGTLTRMWVPQAPHWGVWYGRRNSSTPDWYTFDDRRRAPLAGDGSEPVVTPGGRHNATYS